MGCSSVANVVTAPIKFVGEAVSSVAEFSVGEIIKPVVKMTSGVVKGMADDPFGTLIQIGAMASGNPFAMAAAAGANSARNGGSFGDIVFATTTAYLGNKAGSSLSNSLNLEAGSFTAQAANIVASQVTKQIVSAAASGDDTAEAGQTAAVAAVANFAGGDGDDVLIGGSGNDTLSGEAEYLQSTAFVDNFNLAKKTISEQLATAVEGYNSLPDAAKEVISGGAAAAVASSLSEGKIPSENEIAKVVAPAITTAETTIRAISNRNLSNNATAQIARVIGDISRTAYEGTNPLEARKVDVSKEFQEKINAAIDVVIKDNDLDKAFTNISDSVGNFETATQKANETALPVDAAADAVNKVIANATAMRNGEVEGFSSLEQWQDDNAAYEEGGRTDEELRDKLVAWNTKYNDITAGEESLRAEYNKALEIHTESLNNVDAVQGTLLTNQSNLDDATKPFYKETSKAFTLALRPDFNEEEYRERYSIDPESDAYTHWLATGRSNLVNKQEYDQEISPFAGEDAVNLADNLSDVTDADIASGKARLKITNDGTVRFTNAPITVSRFDPRYNRVVTTEYNSAENKYTVTGDNNETLETITENPDGSFTSTSIVSESFPTSVAFMQKELSSFYPTLEELSGLNPATAINAAGGLNIDPFYDSEGYRDTFSSTVNNLVKFTRNITKNTPLPTNAEIKDTGGIEPYINRNYTDPVEAKEMFEGFGYTPTSEQLQRFVGRGLQTQTAEQVKSYVDPRQVTPEELGANLDYLKPDGRYDDYDGVDYDAIVEQFTGQGRESFQEDKLAAARRYDEQFKQREASYLNSPNYSDNELDAELGKLLGKKGQEITFKDRDFFADMMAQQKIAEEFNASNPNSPNYAVGDNFDFPPSKIPVDDSVEPTTSIYDIFKPKYDLNKDDRIDDADKTILEQVMDGTLSRTGLPEGNPFRSEGIKGELEETQRQIKEQEANRVQRETMQSNQALLQQLGQTSTVNVEGPDPAEIGYVYDPFGESIFATREQESAFVDPFTQRSNIPPQGIAGVLGGRRYG